MDIQQQIEQLRSQGKYPYAGYESLTISEQTTVVQNLLNANSTDEWVQVEAQRLGLIT